MNAEMVLTAGALALLTVETVKWAFRKYKEDPNFEFAPRFYELMIPYTTAVWGVALGLSGFADPVDISTQTLVSWGLAILVELVLYNAGVQPFKAFRRASNGS
jgi:hypothetical protein